MTECKQCGRPLPADAVGGACPACLLGLARPADPNAALGETRDRDAGNSPVWFPPAAELNERFTQYQVEALIGQGGMGAVYKAHQPSLDRAVAIKIMSPRIADDPTFAERFSREARTMARLNHQNIVNVYDFGNVAGLYYLVMEYVEGVNLRLAMKAGQLNAEQALAIVPQVCEALQFAHDAGIVHRDIKPENILIDRRGRVKIADFGLAKLVAEENSQQWTLTGSRQVLGTLSYMAPEQIERPASVDHRADIYSLGVVLYELLTGELPLGRFQLPGEKHAGHAALDEVVARTLEKAPERRFQKASEFRTAVETARQSSGFRPIGPARDGKCHEGQAAPAAAFAPAASSDVRHPRVSFTIDNPFHGMTVTHGVLKATGDGVQVDFANRENVFGQPFGAQGQHVLAYWEILKAEFKEGWYRHTVILEMDSPASHKGLPSEKPGTFSFSIAGKDRDDARRVVNAIREAIGQPVIVVRPEKPEEARANARKRVGWSAAGLILAGLFNLLLVPIMFGTFFLFPTTTTTTTKMPQPAATVGSSTTTVLVSESQNEKNILIGDTIELDKVDAQVGPPVPPESRPNRASVNSVTSATSTSQGSANVTVLAFSSIAGLFWMLIGGFLLSAGYCMASLQKWGWCLAMAIVAVIPIHPGWILGLPSGIMALVELSRPSNREQFNL